MERSTAILADHPINLARMERGDLPATQIWLFWPGMQPGAMPSFASVFAPGGHEHGRGSIAWFG